MKKLVLTSVCAIAMTSVVFAQGTVNWGSTALTPSAITLQTNATAYSPLFGGGATGKLGVGATATIAGGFYSQLLYTSFSGSQVAQPGSLAALGAWNVATGLTATNQTGTAGRLTSSAVNTGATVPWSNGTTQSIMLVTWSSNLGTTWATALASLNSVASLDPSQNYFFGMSTTGYINPGTANPGVTLFANAAGTQGLPIFSLNTQLYLVPVPEPTTLALIGLGGASLLLFRRRK